MRLHRLALTNVKGVAHREVVFPRTGVVVLEGANEVGKTSMIEALDLVVDFKDSSRDRKVLAMRPVGHDAHSAIEVEMSCGTYRFTYRKQWFKHPSTTLSIQTPRHEQLAGTVAHERVLTILAESADLALWKALRLMQATPLNSVELNGSTTLAAALDEAAGRCPDTGNEGESLVAAAQAAFTSYFTARTGVETGAYRAARERLESARVTEQSTKGQLEDVAQDIERHEVVCARTRECEVQLASARAECQALDEQWAQASELVTTAAQASATTDSHRRRLEWAEEHRRERREQVRSVTARAEAAAAEADVVRAMTAAVTPAEAELQTLAADLAEAEADAERLAAAREIARQDVDRLRHLADRDLLEGRLRRLDESVQDRQIAATDLERDRIDPVTLNELEELAQAVAVAQAAQRAGGGMVSLTGLAEAGATINVDGHEVHLAQQEQLPVTLTGQVTVVVPDRVQITWQAGSGARQLADALDRAVQGLSRRLQDLGAADMAAARVAAHRRREAEERWHQAERTIQDLLAGEREDELRTRFQLLQATVEAGERPAGRAEPPTDVTEATVTSARLDAEHRQARSHALELAGFVAQLRTVLDHSRVELARAEARSEALSASLMADQVRLETVRDSTPDPQLDEQVRQAAAELATAEQAEQALRQALAGLDPDSLQARVAAAQAAVVALERQREELRDEKVGIEARLDQAGQQGRQEAHDAAVVEFAQAERAFRAIDRRANAARLLHETLQRRRAEAKQAYVEPFQQAVCRLGRVVFGPSLSVEIDDDLSVRARVLDGERIPYEALSTGAKEQLAILTRLACASLVDVDAGVPVVIDDALGYSDPERLRRVGAAFGLVGEDAQVLLLTCTPGRYASIPAAHVVRLGSD